MTRLSSERAFHDRQAAERRRALRPDDLRFDDAAYLGHESWIAPAFALLGDVAGRRVLDLGCGHGMAAVVLARRGARVTACDLSPGYLAEARLRAEVNGVPVRFAACDGAALPFADGAFDRVFGSAILHHLDLKRAAWELRRVLRPGGVAVFCEPWGGNPVLEAARRVLPYPGKERTPDEAPLRGRDLKALRQVFPDLRATGYQLTAMLGRLWKRPGLTAALHRCDRALLRGWPHLQRYCRYVTIRMNRPEA